MAQIRVERIPVGELFNFTQEAQKNQKRYNVLPITALRALAQSKNPAASPDDIGLLVAYSGDRCIGYLGILPCFLRQKGEISKVYALITFFVDESFRGKSAASTIMANAIALRYDLLLAGYTPAAEKLYRRNPQWFKPAGFLSFIRIHAIPHSSLLWLLKNRFKPTQSLFSPFFSANQRIADAGGWRFLYRFLQPSVCKKCAEIEAHPVSMVRNPEEKINGNSLTDRPSFYRDVNIVNWMIKYPWVTEDSSISLNYIFSYHRELFRFLPFELYAKQSGKRLGYLVLSVTKKSGLTVLKILDHVLANKAHLPCILDVALSEASRWKAELIVGPHKLWPFIKTHALLKLLTQHQKRGYFIHSTPHNSLFPDNPYDLHLDFCDSDLPFT